MKNYLSMGMGVNSVAMILLAIEQKIDYEDAVFVDHGADYPETYEYLNMFQLWLKEHNYKQIVILKPNVEGFDNLYDYCKSKKIIPSKMFRWCTDKFKVRVQHKYFDAPCFNFIGFDAGEPKRAKISTTNGIENRYLLIENGINREDCKNIIRSHGLPIPIKSGCYICPFQKLSQVKDMRRYKNDLFCKAITLENIAVENRKNNNKLPIYLFGSGYGKPISVIINENQLNLFKEDDYPPCQCGL